MFEEDLNFVYMVFEFCVLLFVCVVDFVGAANESESFAAETNAKALNIKCIDEVIKYLMVECLRILYDVVVGLVVFYG